VLIHINQLSQRSEFIIPFGESLSAQSLNIIPSAEVQDSLLKSELAFLYSTQFFAEDNGEVALEHMRERTYQPTKQNKILDMQIKDELVHVDLLKKVIDQIGLDETSTGFAKGYTEILYSAPSLSEKVFIFQIMTEAVSASYLNWRLHKIENKLANDVDQEIFSDELRHIKMGKSLLEMCDKDELKNILTPTRRRELIRVMSRMCSNHFLNGIQSILKDHGLIGEFKHKMTDLDKMVAKTLLHETNAVSKILDGVV
jgi:hypothetical protein